MPLTAEMRKLIFNKLKKNLAQCSPPMMVKDRTDNAYELIGNKPVPYGHDKKIIPGMFFASIAHCKDSVAFYFFPSYLNRDLQKVAPTLYKALKSKTCFHFKKEEQINEKELKALLKTGLEVWKRAGYIE